MANEVLVAGIGDLTISEAMAAEFLFLLEDRADFLMHPALHYAGQPASSNVIRVSQLGLGAVDLLAAGTEGTALANTALTDASDDVTVAWYGKVYESSDLAKFAANGKLDPRLFAQDAAVSVAQTLVNLIAALGSGFSNTVGTSGVNMTIADFTDAITQLEISKAEGARLAVLHHRQYGDLRTDSLSLGGAAQFRLDSQGLVQTAMSQNRGQLFGVDVFSTGRVPTANAGADRAGMMFTKGGVLWADGNIQTDGDPNIVNLGGRAAFERVRTGKAGLTAYVTHAFLGVAEGIDEAGVGIITDA